MPGANMLPPKSPVNSSPRGHFEGLLAAMTIHGIVHHMVYANLGKMPGRVIVKRYIDDLKRNVGDVS